MSIQSLISMNTNNTANVSNTFPLSCLSLTGVWSCKESCQFCSTNRILPRPEGWVGNQTAQLWYNLYVTIIIGITTGVNTTIIHIALHNYSHTSIHGLSPIQSLIIKMIPLTRTSTINIYNTTLTHPAWDTIMSSRQRKEAPLHMTLTDVSQNISQAQQLLNSI